MAKAHGSSVKDDKLYADLRRDGASKQKAARIANARAAGTIAIARPNWTIAPKPTF